MSKSLSLPHVFCIAAGAMISSGIFILPGLAHAKAGPAVIFSYFFAGLLATAGILSIAELTTAMPKAGGDYFYISRGLGPAAGTVAGLLSWFSLSVKTAFALIGLAVLVQPYNPVNLKLTVAILCFVFAAINLFGTSEAARLQVMLVVALLALMVAYIVKGAQLIDIRHLEPFAPNGIKSVFYTTGFVFVSYGGLIKVASVAGEVKNPGKIIPLAMILACATMVILYTLMIFITSGILGPELLDKSLTPISDAARAMAGKPGYILAGLAAALAFITTANAGIMTASRYLVALSSDRLLPETISQTTSKKNTPYKAISITAIVIIFTSLLQLETLVKAASTVFVLSYVLAAFSVIVLRESGVQNYRPVFKTPLYPWLQLATIIGFCFILLEMGEQAYIVTVLIVIVGFIFYYTYGRRKVESESALLHLVEKITARELVTGTLENELKDIIRERDQIVQDKFDHLVENSPAVDLEGPCDLKQLFQSVAAKLSKRLDMHPDQLRDLLLERETQGSTVLSPTLAVPHIIIPGEGKFEMIIARCKKGARFSDSAPEVTTIFVLAGTKDLRNFYLRVLSAIAHIVQTKHFDKNWNSAKNEQALKDIVLLAQRNRLH